MGKRMKMKAQYDRVITWKRMFHYESLQKNNWCRNSRRSKTLWKEIRREKDRGG
jgi:hypothetical protein